MSNVGHEGTELFELHVVDVVPARRFDFQDLNGYLVCQAPHFVEVSNVYDYQSWARG